MSWPRFSVAAGEPFNIGPGMGASWLPCASGKPHLFARGVDQRPADEAGLQRALDRDLADAAVGAPRRHPRRHVAPRRDLLLVEEVVRETEHAFLIRFGEGWQEWVPKSQIADAEDYTQGDAGCTMSFTKWIADKLGIEGET